MNITEGLVWELQNGQWVQTLDAWPPYRRGAKIQANNEEPWGDGAYTKHEAVRVVKEWIAGKLPEKYYRFAILPGKAASAETKQKLADINAKKKAELGQTTEHVPVESYISEE